MIDLALDNRIILDSDLDCALQEIDILLNTENTELLGYTNYGVNIDQFLWALTPTTTDLQQYIQNKISEYCVYANKFDVDVDCKFFQGEYRSIYLITIKLTDTETGATGTRRYQYQ